MFSKGVYLIIVSMVIFGILNLIENLIHYNIGRTSVSNKSFIYELPLWNDLINIITIMIIFGIAQGLITEYFIND